MLELVYGLTPDVDAICSPHSNGPLREPVMSGNFKPVVVTPIFKWTKESVEHVRNLHFALIVSALGLILLVGSAKSDQKALAQITEITGLKQHWSPDWIWQHRIFGRDNWAERSDLKHHRYVDITPKESAEEQVPAISPLIVTVYKSQDPNLHERTQFEVALPSDLWLIQSPIIQPPLALVVQKGDDYLTADPLSPYSYPDNLTQFKGWWTGLQTGRTLIHPDWLMGVCTFVDLVNRDMAGCTVVPKSRYQGGPVHTVKTLTLVSKINGGGPLIYQPSYRALEPDSGLTLVIRLASATTFKVDQSIVASYLGWKPGEPKTSFPELLQAAKGIENEQLDDLQKTLTNNASKGPETFEAFSIKLPAEQITITGILLLLAIQLYLLLCFQQRSPDIPSDDAVWTIPWLGMDPSPLGRAVFFGSLAIVPVAIIALGVNAILHGAPDGIHWSWKFWTAARDYPLLFVSTTLLALAIVTSLVLFLITWNRRPRACNPEPSAGDCSI